MNWEATIFWALATMIVAPSLAMVFSKNIVHMAFWLLTILLGVAGMYLQMGADFLGMTQVFVYIGGINVLLLFGIMLTNQDPVYVRRVAKRPTTIPALIMGTLVLLGLVKTITGTKWVNEAPETVEPTADALGVFLLSDYILPFEIISILLLVVLVGAAFIARRDGKEEEQS